MKKETQFKKFAEWLALPLAEKNPATLAGFSGIYKVSLPTLYKWQKLIEQEQGTSTTDNEVAQFLRNLTLDATKLGAKTEDRKLYATIKGLTKQEIEHKFEFQPTDYNRVATIVIARLQELRQSIGSCPLCGVPSLLPDQIRQDTGQDTGNNQLGAVAAPPATS